MNRRRGQSELIAYVLLILVALSLSPLVYKWLKSNVPAETKGCPEDISLIIKNYSCSEKKLSLTLENVGLFYIDGFLIKIANQSGEIATLPLNGPQSGGGYTTKKLNPEEDYSGVFDFSSYNTLKEIEIEPIRLVDKDVKLCTAAVIKQSVEGC